MNNLFVVHEKDEEFLQQELKQNLQLLQLLLKQELSHFVCYHIFERFL